MHVHAACCMKNMQYAHAVHCYMSMPQVFVHGHAECLFCMNMLQEREHDRKTEHENENYCKNENERKI
jgi:hypothetical protein